MKRSPDVLRRGRKVLRYCLIAIVLVGTLFPLVWMFSYSIKPRQFLVSIPPVLLFHPTFDSYVQVLQKPSYLSAYLNSLIASTSVLISLVIGSLAAYSYARFKTRRTEDVKFWILSTRMFPQVAVIIPIFLLMRVLNLLDTNVVLIIVYTCLNLPIVVWMMSGFFEEVPVAIEEAAMVDGCSRLEAFLKISLPLAAPGLVATAVFCFMLTWNEFLSALILTGGKARTLPVELSTYLGLFDIDWGALSAAGALAAAPVLVFGLLIKKYLVRGLTFGVVKG